MTAPAPRRRRWVLRVAAIPGTDTAITIEVPRDGSGSIYLRIPGEAGELGRAGAVRLREILADAMTTVDLDSTDQ